MNEEGITKLSEDKKSHELRGEIMKRIMALMILSLVAFALMIITSACNDANSVNEADVNFKTTDVQAFLKLADKSPSVASFTPNYNEEEAMAISSSLGKDFYPIKVGQQLAKTDENLTLVKDSVTASGTLVQQYDGKLIIAGTFQPPTYGIRTRVDTIIEKPYSTTITRQIHYERIDSTGNDTLDWKVVGISLPAGGTGGDDISIQKLTLASQDSTITVDDPNTYFFDVGNDNDNNLDNDIENFKAGYNGSILWKNWRQLFTWFKGNQAVTLTVEILSSSSDPDVVTLTYGAMMDGKYRTKEKFDLISTTPDGILYRKVYQTHWKTHQFPGRRHAVINALPRNVVYDSDSTVVEKTWGIPYKVN